MDTVILILLLVFALLLCGLVLLQRSEGGGLGIGGGGSGGMGGRPKANPLARLTWAVAIGFMSSAAALTMIAAQKTANDSVIGLPDASDTNTDGQAPLLDGESLLPPTNSADDLVPPAPSDN